MFYKFRYRLLCLQLVLFTIFSCKNIENGSEHAIEKTTQDGVSNNENLKKAIPSFYAEGIPVYENFEELEPILRNNNDTTYVINFWATWCKPCIHELPYFKDLDSVYAQDKVKVVLVSLDFPEDVESKLVSFAKEKDITSKTVVLLDGKYNDWVDKVSPAWSGAIPATYIYNKNRKDLFQTPFENTEDLMEVIEPFL